jgi:hypothetical protein
MYISSCIPEMEPSILESNVELQGFKPTNSHGSVMLTVALAQQNSAKK